MFLEEDGCGGMREGERLGLPLVLSTLNLLVDKTGTILFKAENFMWLYVGVFGAQKSKASVILVQGTREEMALLCLRLTWGSLFVIAFQSLILFDAFLVLLPTPCFHPGWGLNLLYWFTIINENGEIFVVSPHLLRVHVHDNQLSIGITNTWDNQLFKRKDYFGSQMWRFQSMIGWLHRFRACDEAAHHGGNVWQNRTAPWPGSQREWDEVFLSPSKAHTQWPEDI